MALGQLLWVIGDTLYSIHDLAGSDSFPAAGDYFYLAAYPLLALGLFHLVNRTRSSGDLPGTLDTWTMVVGLTLVSYELLGRPAIDTGVSAMATLVSVAYPFGDIMLLAGLVGLVTTTGWWNTSIKLLLTAVSLQLVADTASTSPTARDLLPAGHLLARLPVAGLLPRLGSRCPASDDGPVLRTGARSRPALPARTAPGRRSRDTRGAGHPRGPGCPRAAHRRLAHRDRRRRSLLARAGEDVRRDPADLDRQQPAARAAGPAGLQARHDSLTLLPNRAHGFTWCATRWPPPRKRLDDRAAVHRPRPVQAHQRHPRPRLGDQVLRRVAERLLASVRGEDCAIRLGGDEFVVLLQDVGSATRPSRSPNGSWPACPSRCTSARWGQRG